MTRERYREFMQEHVYPNESALTREDDAAERLVADLRARAKSAGLWAPHLPPEAGGTGAVGFVPILFEPRQEQVVLRRDAPEERAVAGMAIRRFEGVQHFAHFQAARRPADDASAARVALAAVGDEPADAAQGPHANEMLA